MMRALAIAEAYALCARRLPKSQANAVAEAEGTITAQPPEAETVSRVAPGRTGDGATEAGAAHSAASDAGSQADDAAGGVTVGGDESGTAASFSPSPAIPPVVAALPLAAQGSAGFLPARSSLPFPPSGGMNRLIARDGFRVAPPHHGTVVSDPLGRPNSRRPRGASVVGQSPRSADRPIPGVPMDCRSLRAPALSLLHECLRLQAYGSRDRVIAFPLTLLHLSRASVPPIVSHGGLIECGQNLGADP